MSNIPSFNFKPTISQDEFNKELAKSNKAKRFTPGQYNVKITNVAYHENKETKQITCKSDPTWILVAVTLVSADGRERKEFLQIPTSDVLFRSASGKKTVFPFRKLQEFLAGLGIYLDYTNFAKVIPAHFSPDTLDSLVGESMDMVLRYREPYIKGIGESSFAIMINGSEYSENGQVAKFSDRDSAKAFAAATLNKVIDIFPEEVVTYIAAPERSAPMAAVNEENWD